MEASFRGYRFDWESRPYVMGIVNVTPDSFSGDGLGTDVGAAIEQGLRMVEEGADIIDVGGESTRPRHTYGDQGALPVTVEEEIARVLPIVDALASQAGVPISIDTSKLEVAEAAIAAGAAIVNDVWGLQRSPGLADLAAMYGLGLVVMHNQEGTAYAGDPMEEIKTRLGKAVAEALAAGMPVANVIIDPGIGFGKTAEHNLAIIRRLDELAELGHPILVGTSRKSFIGNILDLPPNDRVEGTAATVAAAVIRGANVVRVHDVKEMVRVVKVAAAIR